MTRGYKPVVGNQKTYRGKAKYLGGVGKKITGMTKRRFKPNLQRIKVVELDVRCGSRPKSMARLVLEVDGVARTAEAQGDGPVDATFNAIKQLVPHSATLPLFQIHAVTEGTDAQAEVTVRLEENGKTVNGQAAETDTILASARAYVTALNKLLVKREKTAPAALSA